MIFETQYQSLKKMDDQVSLGKCLNPEPWIRKMANTGHLKLDLPEFSVAECLNEVSRTSINYAQCSLRTPKEASELGALYQPHWFASALVNYNKSSTSFFCKLAKEVATLEETDLQRNSRLKYLDEISASTETPCATALNWGLTSEDVDHYKTELWDQLPYTTCYIEKYIGSPLFRCWFLLIKKNGYLNWHSHARLDEQGNYSYDKFIIHIPLITNPGAIMHVRIEDQVHSQHYKAGEAWVLNSMHNHCLENSGSEDRVHLVITTPTWNPKAAALIERNIHARG